MLKVITIDGPASSGKGTLSRKLAESLNFRHIDNGSIFRTVAFDLLSKGVGISDSSEVLGMINSADLNLVWDEGKCIVLLGNRDVSEHITALEVGSLTSQLASNEMYFTALANLTRGLVETGGYVSDGRAVGTFIFPNADIKFFISAAPEIRAKRRYEDLVNQGKEVTYDQVLQDVLERDHRDMTRTFCPLTIPEGAFVIDTSYAIADESLTEMINSISLNLGEDYLPKLK